MPGIGEAKFAAQARKHDIVTFGSVVQPDAQAFKDLIGVDARKAK